MVYTGYICKHFNTESRCVAEEVKKFDERYVYRKDESLVTVLPLIQALEGKTGEGRM